MVVSVVVELTSPLFRDCVACLPSFPSAHKQKVVEVSVRDVPNCLFFFETKEQVVVCGGGLIDVGKITDLAILAQAILLKRRIAFACCRRVSWCV